MEFDWSKETASLNAKLHTTIPKRSGGIEQRYIIFLRVTLLAYKAGTTLLDMKVLSKEEREHAASDFCTTHPSCPKVVLQEYEESQQDNTESNEQDQLLIEADLPEETGQEQDEWMAALASHSATSVYESGDEI